MAAANHQLHEVPAKGLPIELISNLSGAGAVSNEARLRLLEKRLAGQDSIETDAVAPKASSSLPMQPGTFAPRQPLSSFNSSPYGGPGAGGHPVGAATQVKGLLNHQSMQQQPSKRKRAMSPAQAPAADMDNLISAWMQLALLGCCWNRD
jgi:hypothetical protein